MKNGEKNSGYNESIETDAADPDMKTVPVFSESLVINKDIQESGKVHVRKSVVERKELVREPVRTTEVKTWTVKIDEIITGSLPEVRYVGDTMIIPVINEELVVIKQNRLIEEIHVQRIIKTEELDQSFILRSEKITIDRS